MLLSACVSDGARETTSGEAEPETVISVTVPAERLTPFCQAMIDLTERIRSADADESMIVDTYRSIVEDVPPEIASDFRAVLAALESGAPPPTDPPPETIETVPSTLPEDRPDTTDDPATASLPVEGLVDEGFASGTSPAERINNYVTFSCRDTQNNPGPPPTQPLEEPTGDT